VFPPLLPQAPTIGPRPLSDRMGTAVSQLAAMSLAVATSPKPPLAPSFRTLGTEAALLGRELCPRG
jgi:hypothetical protein